MITTENFSVQQQSKQTISQRTKLKVYAVGGCGINQMLPYTGNLNTADTFAEIDVRLIDTSYSNLLPNTPKDVFYHIDGAEDGSGKDKATNARVIKNAIPRILSTPGFEPENFNVVVSSTSGGKTLPVVN